MTAAAIPPNIPAEWAAYFEPVPENPRRAAVLAEARGWLRTPYHHMGRIKGGGADCLTFLVEVFERTGLVPPVEVPFYRQDVMFHRGEETYLEGLLGHGREVAAPEPGDVVLFQWGRIFGHGGIVLHWPMIVHSCAHAMMVCPGDATQGRLRGRPVKFISAF